MSSAHNISLRTLSALRMLVGASCLLVPRQAGVLFGIPLAPGAAEAVLLGRMTGVRDLVLGAYLWKRVRECDGEVAKKKAKKGEEEAGAGADDPSRMPLLFNKVSSGTTTAATKKDREGDRNAAPPARDSVSQPPDLTAGLEHGHGPDGPTTTLAGLRLAQSQSALRSAVWLGLVVDTIDMASVIFCALEGNPLSDLAKVTVGGGAAVFVLIAAQYLVAHTRG
ncbi:uncharacterized protein A1O5_03625 [Cladophialophora psammophila CBS 110553]|uniref:Threonine/serine exporter-like N-terminal domain-containing protein n=1 Tax=Cladophialophora psammophila CBS 110553 TaxID=1182543 RepID=W9X128_9EURO|nr:uncharacterized protein A1O5_03625 [Cladophialophora psammophila CBS 110553]EXJ73863.1 hypothetical protein A1O5_03625 [Cladophialophora psammophila CBS 110553]